jgi:hypothetical protein
MDTAATANMMSESLYSSVVAVGINESSPVLQQRPERLFLLAWINIGEHVALASSVTSFSWVCFSFVALGAVICLTFTIHSFLIGLAICFMTLRALYDE